MRPVELPEAPEPLPSPVVDSHCHLDSTMRMSGLDPADAIARAAEVGVTRIVQIGCDPDGSRWAVEAAERWPGRGRRGGDPSQRRGPDGSGSRRRRSQVIEALAQHPRVRAVGETGLDYFRTTDAHGQAVQRETFAAHIAFAKTYDKTLVIHDRDAHAEVLDVLDAEGLPDRIVMHCFSGDADVRQGVPEPRGPPVVRRNRSRSRPTTSFGRRSA